LFIRFRDFPPSIVVPVTIRRRESTPNHSILNSGNRHRAGDEDEIPISAAQKSVLQSNSDCRQINMPVNKNSNNEDNAQANDAIELPTCVVCLRRLQVAATGIVGADELPIPSAQVSAANFHAANARVRSGILTPIPSLSTDTEINQRSSISSNSSNSSNAEIDIDIEVIRVTRAAISSGNGDICLTCLILDDLNLAQDSQGTAAERETERETEREREREREREGDQDGIIDGDRNRDCEDSNKVRNSLAL
jgi:hypothetical protein